MNIYNTFQIIKYRHFGYLRKRLTNCWPHAALNILKLIGSFALKNKKTIAFLIISFLVSNSIFYSCGGCGKKKTISEYQARLDSLKSVARVISTAPYDTTSLKERTLKEAERKGRGVIESLKTALMISKRRQIKADTVFIPIPAESGLWEDIDMKAKILRVFYDSNVLLVEYTMPFDTGVRSLRITNVQPYNLECKATKVGVDYTWENRRVDKPKESKFGFNVAIGPGIDPFSLKSFKLENTSVVGLIGTSFRPWNLELKAKLEIQPGDTVRYSTRIFLLKSFGKL